MHRVLVVVLAACSATSGTRVTRYPDGRPHYEFQLQNGIPHGMSRTWHANGTLRSEGPYVAGKKQGTFVYFDESGTFEAQVYYLDDEEMWRSAERGARPTSAQLTAWRANRSAAEAAAEGPPLTIDTGKTPRPYFASLDRTTSLSRLGLQLGFGGPEELELGATKRFDLFANYYRGRFGGYAQASQAVLRTPEGMDLSGRRTFEGGATYHHAIERVGDLSGRLGLLLPIGEDTETGFIAGTAGSFQRIADFAATFPSTVTLRTSASLTRSRTGFVAQADAGVDWILGGSEAAFVPLARLNAGIGFGGRAGLVSVELANSLRLSDSSKRLHAFGVGGTFWLSGAWITGLLSHTLSNDTSVSATIGYEL